MTGDLRPNNSSKLKNEDIEIPNLYYVDDSLLLSHWIEEAPQSMKFYTSGTIVGTWYKQSKKVTYSYIYNNKEQPISIEDIQVTQSIPKSQNH